MVKTCPECGAAVPGDGSCREENFTTLLGLEASIPGGPGELSHFYAVASYNLQHPVASGLTAEVLAELRSAVADALAGRATPEKLRRRMRRLADGKARVTRRPGDPEGAWYTGPWPITVGEVLKVEPEREPYAATVERWARSVLETLGG